MSINLNEALIDAVLEENLSNVIDLLKRGAENSACTQKGENVMGLAVTHDSHDIVKALASHGADVNRKSFPGTAPLHMATQRNNADMVRLLLALGANREIEDVKGYTPFHLAVRHQKMDCLHVLLEAGCDINRPHREGSIPLGMASQPGRKEVLRCLIEKGADIHFRHPDTGHSVMHMAVRHAADQESMKFLLDRGADISARDYQDLTPLHYACQRQDSRQIRQLLELGADMHALANYPFNGKTYTIKPWDIVDSRLSSVRGHRKVAMKKAHKMLYVYGYGTEEEHAPRFGSRIYAAYDLGLHDKLLELIDAAPNAAELDRQIKPVMDLATKRGKPEEGAMITTAISRRRVHKLIGLGNRKSFSPS